MTLLLLSSPSASRGDEAPLYAQEPYDTIKLDEANKNAELNVLPLDLPDRHVPAKPNPSDELEIHLVDRPRKTYKVAWENIVEVKLFEQRVLDEAERLVEAKKMDEAFAYYDFLTRRYPKMTALGPSYAKYLMAGAKEAFKQEKYEECLALAWELYDRNPDFPGAVTAVLRAAEKLIDKRFAIDDFAGAAALLQQANERLKDRAAPLTTTWTEKLHGKATSLVAQAKQALSARQANAARLAIRQALAAWPDVPGAKELAASIDKEFPEIVVAVSALAGDRSSAGASWEARRSTRLLARSIVEVSQFSDSGNTYAYPLAKLTRSHNDRRIEVSPDREITWSGTKAPLTPIDLAQALAAQAERPEWRELVAGLSLSDAGVLRVDLKQPLTRFEPWLEVPLWPEVSPRRGTTAGSLGPYRLESSDAKEARFTAVDGYFAAGPKSPRQIVERIYPDEAAAQRALRRGEVTIVDRVNPWDAQELAASKQFAVEPYGVPSVHLLVANLRRPSGAFPMLRRAIAHAIDRSGILVGQLSRGKVPPGCGLVDGILGKNELITDVSRAAPELRYDAGAARALAGLTLAELSDSRIGGEMPGASAAEFVLVFIPEETTRLACQAIVQQARAAGITIKLKDAAAADFSAAAKDADLIYVVWTPLEPLAELPRLIGRDGLGGDAGPLVDGLIQDALTAPRGKAAERTARLEAEIRSQQLIIPLWRLTNYVSSQASLSGIGKRPVTLYQNVEKWQFTAGNSQP